RADGKIALGWRRRSDANGMVGGYDMCRALVGVRVDSDGLDTQLAACPHDPNRDLAAIGDEDSAKHARPLLFDPLTRRPFDGDRSPLRPFDPSTFRHPGWLALLQERFHAFLSLGRHAPSGDRLYAERGHIGWTPSSDFRQELLGRAERTGRRLHQLVHIAGDRGVQSAL